MAASAAHGDGAYWHGARLFHCARHLRAKKTVLPRRMFVFHMLAVQLVMALIPDVRQTLGAQVSTWDFVLSQGSGNAGLLIWMAANARWADRQIKMKEANSHE